MIQNDKIVFIFCIHFLHFFAQYPKKNKSTKLYLIRPSRIIGKDDDNRGCQVIANTWSFGSDDAV